VYRIDRCDPTDQQVIEDLYLALESDPENFSAALHFNVVSGELCETPAPSQAELAAEEQALTISSVQMAGYRAAYELWPRYEPGPLNGAFATTSTPLLMLNSPLDAQTTFGPAAAFASHYTGEHQTFVAVERSAHAVASGSPMAEGTCGMRLIGPFLREPSAPLDTSCKDQVLPIDFEQVGFSLGPGTINVWDNAQGLTASAPQNALERVIANRRARQGGAQ